jgi:hypothetical protein
MARPKTGSGEAHGYLTSALVFAGVTALWAVIVRNDPYYRVTDVFGARLPATMIAYLVLMPLAGLLIGRWRYQAPHQGGFSGYVGKLIARFVHFTYVHLLIVLFTVAMATDYFLGLNIDAQIRAIDDRMFDLAARFAPWLAAYLTGFNLGRAMRRGPEAVTSADGMERKPRRGADRSLQRAEPTLEPPPIPAEDLGDLILTPAAPAPQKETADRAASAEVAEPGFLPPQDLDRLRPGLRELR